MKKHFFKYKRNKTLLELTILLIFCMGIIIRDSEFPLVKLNNFMDKYIELLFLSSSPDRTFYNIGISYVAAYIFYIVQIYIPAVTDHNHGFLLIKSHIEDYINDIKKLMLVTNALLEKKDWRDINRGNSYFYIVEKSRDMIFRINFLNTYKRLREQIFARQNDIQVNPLISYLDDNLSELICMLPTKELFDIADNIYAQIQRSTNAEILCNEVLDEIEQTISELQNRYGFLFESFYITDDLTLQSQYIKYLPSLALYTNNELEIKVRLTDVSI